MLRLVITGDIGFEFWKDIPGYEGIYQASTYGRIKRKENNVVRNDGVILHYEEKIKTLVQNKQGYLGCILYKNGKSEGHNVQVWIARTFLPVPKKYRHLIGKYFPSGLPMLQVNHKDENKFQNAVSNLEYMSAKDNTNYGSGIKKRILTQRHCHCKPVLRYSVDGSFIDEFYSAREAERILGYAQTHISNCCIGKTKQAYGYIWKFKNKEGD